MSERWPIRVWRSLRRSRSSMAFDTVRTNKMRSALTVLGVVIGITSIVGMTAMIRGFDQSLRDMIGAIGPNTIFVQRFGVTSFASGAEFRELMQAAEPDDLRRARARGAGDDASSSSTSSSAPARAADAAARVLPRPEDASRWSCSARPRTSPRARASRCSPAGSSTAPKCSTARTSRCSATRRTSCCSSRRHRSDRQDGARRQRALRGGRRLRQAAGRRRLQPRARTTSSSSPTRPTSASSACASRSRVGRTGDASCTIQIAAGAARGRRAGRTRSPTSSASCASATACKLDEPNDFDIAHAGCVPEAVGPDQPGRRSSRWS